MVYYVDIISLCHRLCLDLNIPKLEYASVQTLNILVLGDLIYGSKKDDLLPFLETIAVR